MNMNFDFKPREPKEKYLVRFWSTPLLWNNFSAVCENNGWHLQDVLNQFIEQFADQHRGLPPTITQPEDNG